MVTLKYSVTCRKNSVKILRISCKEILFLCQSFASTLRFYYNDSSCLSQISEGRNWTSSSPHRGFVKSNFKQFVRAAPNTLKGKMLSYPLVIQSSLIIFVTLNIIYHCYMYHVFCKWSCRRAQPHPHPCPTPGTYLGIYGICVFILNQIAWPEHLEPQAKLLESFRFENEDDLWIRDLT